MIVNSIYKVIFLTVLILTLQIFIPTFSFYNQSITVDLLLIYLTCIGYYYGRLYAIIIGFIFGIAQDIITQWNLLGVITLAKSVTAYGFGTLILYRNVWSKSTKSIFIFLVFLIHYCMIYFFYFNGINISVSIPLKIILLNSTLNFIILFIIDKTFFLKGIFSE